MGNKISSKNTKGFLYLVKVKSKYEPLQKL